MTLAEVTDRELWAEVLRRGGSTEFPCDCENGPCGWVHRIRREDA